MRKAAWISLLLLSLTVVSSLNFAQDVFAHPPAQATIAPSIFIQSPREGQALQGVEIIEGKIRGDGFQQGKIAFRYADSGEQERTWFFVADIKPAVEDSAQTSFIVEWDTTQITDGNYDLRVVAQYQAGAAIFELIPNVRIRNYSPVETATPAQVIDQDPAEVTRTATIEPTPANTTTPLPANPAEVRSDDLYQTLKISGIAVVVLFIVGGVYWQIKNRD